ncbi:hypothetical protein LAZ40_07210 [Cereibacter sphaeroides]|uniref:hypothetical protein n=1 Tax=Cereibacter sphaeroides TaxID=1063 RepID=UPI001F295201|nr:hypothetical protein [Cereibacter sphaeroides]MCE6958836.1 hypothetical protein [Cereibacter sphaeroides]MCE6973290.1 hypothetical protein [Cereibacter sphaeroides]
MKKLFLLVPLLAMAACSHPDPVCTFNADGMKMEGFTGSACEKMSVGYNQPR